MKSSFSIIETLISVLILSIAISALLQTKNNNLNILSLVKDKNTYDGLISIHSSVNSVNDENINFKNYISLDDDTLRKKLKNEKIKYKYELNDKFDLKIQDKQLNFQIYQEKYTSDTYGAKSFYRLKLQ